MERVALFVLIILIPQALHSPSPTGRWIVWNVGQGEWVTRIGADRCLHFDMGGERLPRRAIQQACSDKENIAHFSHWDLDHVGFAAKAKAFLPRLCLAQPPLGRSSKRKLDLFKGWPPCQITEYVKAWKPETAGRSKNSNEKSIIYIAGGKMLLPGDATAAEEKLFVARTHVLSTIRWLILAHHGSATSTSKQLLEALPSVRQAVATARRAKYGHPHAEVERRLRLARVAMLSTEEWGTIAFEE